jgi:hypothetical protein
VDALIAGWFSFVNVFNGEAYAYGYGFPAKVSNEQVSNIAAEVVDGQGAQVLNVFSDYTNGDHANGLNIEANIFREFTIQEADSGTFRFAFQAKLPNENAIAAPGTAAGFIKLLDPNAGFATVYFETVETTNVGSAAYVDLGLDLTIDASTQAGLIIQFGFTNTVTEYASSGVLYDNVSVSRQ